MPPSTHGSSSSLDELEHLLSSHSSEMADLGPSTSDSKKTTTTAHEHEHEHENNNDNVNENENYHYHDSDHTRLQSSNFSNAPAPQSPTLSSDITVHRVYKRRFFGLFQLVLLNIIVSWDWLSFSSVSTTAATYFRTTESAINWLSTAFLFAFCFISPLVIWTLNKGGPKSAILAAAGLILLGNWIRYAGAKVCRFGVVMLGQVLIGLAQPFVLSAPTRYSDLWFSDRGRISATAVASLANPLGGALGQLISPFWATKPNEIPSMVLYVAIIVRICHSFPIDHQTS